jgi:uncharacterized protein
MKIAHIGATGNVGSRIVEEALRRGHDVTAIARNPEKLDPRPRLTLRRGDVNDQATLSPLIAGHDVVISSVRFQILKPRSLITSVKHAKVKRLLVVGGAGTLEVAPGVQLLDTPNFPAAYKPEALGGREFLNVLRVENDLEWTFLCPSAEFSPGQRTGKFRLGKDTLLTLPNGESKISMEDFAIAMVDEVENPKHVRDRFTVGY